MIRVGVIGLGVGEAHVEGFLSHPDVEVKSICDFSEERVRTIRDRFPAVRGGTCVASEILESEDIDLVSIASYDQYHCEQILSAIAHGKHVFVEKPFCLSKEEAKAIRCALRANPSARISSNLVLRRHPRFIELERQIRSGRFGDIYLIEGAYQYGRIEKLTNGWRAEAPFYSVTYGGGVHIVDLLLWLKGMRVTDVVSYGTKVATASTPFRHLDTVVSVLRFEDGSLGQVTSNFPCVHPHFHRLAVFGTDASFENRPTEGLLTTSRDKDEKPERIGSGGTYVPKGVLIHDFIDSILLGKTPQVSMEEMFSCMSVCFAIEEGAGTEAKIKVEYV